MPLDDIQLNEVTPETAPQVMERLICAPNFLRGVSLEDIKQAEQTKAKLEDYLKIAEPLALRVSRDDITQSLRQMELPGIVTGIATHLRGLVHTTLLDMRNDSARALERVPPVYKADFKQLLARTENIMLALSDVLERASTETFYEHIGADQLEAMTADLRQGKTQTIGDFNSFDEFDAMMRA